MTNRSIRADWFDPGVPLHPSLNVGHLARVIASVEHEVDQFVEVYFEQANVFSALVGIFAARAFSSLTVYEKPRHTDLARQRFPDLKRRGSTDLPSSNDSLKSRQVHGLGLCRRTTTIRVGIASFATSWIVRLRSSPASVWSYGEFTLRY